MPNRARQVGHVLTLLALVLFLSAAGGPTARAPAGAFFGLDVPNADPQAFAAFEQRLGAAATVRAIFVKLDSTGALDTLRAMPAGVIPFVTLEPWSTTSTWGNSGLPRYALRTIIDGMHDAALRAIGRVLAGLHRPVYLRFAHEMNGTWYPWAEAVNGNRPGDYVAAWRHAHDLIAPITGPDVRWVWSPNIVTGLPAGGPSLAELYPGDAYVDDVGLTGYSHGTSVAATFGPTVAELRSITARPIVLSEIGVEGPEQDAWLAALGSFVADRPDIAGFVYYDTAPGTTGATGSYRLTSRGSFAALASAVRTATTERRAAKG